MSQSTRSVIVCHVTPRRNLPSIWRNGLLPHFARGVLPVVWFCTPSRKRWASQHVCDQNATSDIIVLRLQMPRSWLRRFRRGIWHCAQPDPVQLHHQRVASLSRGISRLNPFPRSAPFGGGALEHHHMCNRKCQVWLEITKADGTVTRYSLLPLSAAQLGADFVAGFQLLNRSESPSPIYQVRLSPSAAVCCTCPAFVWDRQRGQEQSALARPAAPTCKHCEALQAAGLLPVAFVQRLAERTRLLDIAEERALQLQTAFDDQIASRPRQRPDTEGRSMSRRQQGDAEEARHALRVAVDRLAAVEAAEIIVLLMRGAVETIRPEPPPTEPGTLPADMGEYDRDILRARRQALVLPAVGTAGRTQAQQLLPRPARRHRRGWPHPPHTERLCPPQRLTLFYCIMYKHMEAGTGRDVRSADERQFTGHSSAQGQRQIQSVQHQASRPRGADIEAIRPLAQPRFEDEVRAAERGAAELALADRGGGADAHQMLGLQSRFGAPGAERCAVKRACGQQRQGETRWQDLSAALAERTIQFQYGIAHTLQESRRCAEVHAESVQEDSTPCQVCWRVARYSASSLGSWRTKNVGNLSSVGW